MSFFEKDVIMCLNVLSGTDSGFRFREIRRSVQILDVDSEKCIYQYRFWI